MEDNFINEREMMRIYEVEKKKKIWKKYRIYEEEKKNKNKEKKEREYVR